MKKLILSAAILLGSLSTFTASAQAQKSVEKTATTPQEYTEIKKEEVPSVVTESLKKLYPEAVISKAYINENKNFKLEISIGDKTDTVFIDAKGSIVNN